MNKVCLVGRLTRDALLSQTQNGKTRARVTLAVDGLKNAQGEKQADFIPVSAWEKTADLLGKYAQKGSRLGVAGRLRTWKHEVEGKTRYEMEVVADSIEFLSGPQESGRSGMAQPAPHTQAHADTAGTEGDEDDLPF